jgi:hypothetical protein
MKLIPVLIQHTYPGNGRYLGFVCTRMLYKMELSHLLLLHLLLLVIMVPPEPTFSTGTCVLLPCPLPQSSTPFGSALTFFLLVLLPFWLLRTLFVMFSPSIMLLKVSLRLARHGHPRLGIQSLVIFFESKGIQTHRQVRAGPSADGAAEATLLW